MRIFSIGMIFVALFSFSGAAFADWESKFITTSSKGEFPKIEGRIYVRANRIRVDSPYPLEMSLYAREGSSRVEAAVPTFKIRLTSTISAFAGRLPACFAKNFETCAKSLGMKKKGSEKCGDSVCGIFEGTPKMKGVKSIRVWHPADEKEAIFSKSVVRKSNGDEITTAFVDIEKKTRPDSFFAVPAGYKNAGSLDQFFGDLRGKSDP